MRMDSLLFTVPSSDDDSVSGCESVDTLKKLFFFSPTPQVSVLVLVIGLACHAAELPAAQWSGDKFGNVTRCVENEQYLHQGLCCLNCQAGKQEGTSAQGREPTFF